VNGHSDVGLTVVGLDALVQRVVERTVASLVAQFGLDRKPDATTEVCSTMGGVEAAAYVGCCPRTLWGLANSGQIKSIKVGHLRRYTRQDLDDFISRRKK
jgi:excisionase family DNA binding protein